MSIADPQRLHALDAVRGFALLLGVAFHAALSFVPGWPPGIWAMVDNAPSAFLGDAAFVSHVFRMTLFFFVAGFFARLLHARLGTGGFCRNRLLRIALPLVAGWVVLYPLIASIWLAGIGKSFGGSLPPMPEIALTPGAFPLAHLWFLYQLLQLYAIALLVRALVARIDRSRALRGAADALVSGTLRLPLAPLLLAVPVALALMALPTWFYWAGIPAPDRTLLPQLAPLVGYGVAFGFGWLVQRSDDALASIARHWLPHLLLGALATAWLLLSLRVSPMAPPGFPAQPFALVDGTTLTKAGFAVMSGIAAWGLSLGITGAALRFLSAYSPLRRYLADASYWVYLAHLPLVAALQVWVGHWPMHWTLKYAFILTVSLALLFASYHWLVRGTLVGQLLNGRRWRGAPEPPPAAHDPGNTGASVARLRGVSKTFAGTTALDDIDIELRSGELLALLGPNGAGKSTAIALWLGLIEADAGSVVLLGGAPQDAFRRQRLGAMMQDVELPRELSPRELVRLASSYYADPLPLEETLRRACVTAFADMRYGNLSGGQKRLAQFAVAICGQPRVLFLDEPSVGLDVHARQALWASIRALLSAGCSIVLTTHYLEEAEALADRVAVIARGRLIAAGSVDAMRALVVRCRVSCESRLSAAEVGRWPGVFDAHRDRDRLHLTASNVEAVVRRLLAEDPTLARLEVRQAGLDEAFSTLTSEAA